MNQNSTSGAIASLKLFLTIMNQTEISERCNLDAIARFVSVKIVRSYLTVNTLVEVIK